MQLSRETESLLRELLDVLQLTDTSDVDDVLRRLEHLQRALAPENEFALILSWLGKCRLVHKLGQEQLPLHSTDQYRVPDLFAAFDYNGRVVPALIEVKTTEVRKAKELNRERLSLKPHYLRYAELLGVPMLIAWRHLSIWTLFDIHAAELAETNYRIDFATAMRENLLGVLGGDFSYSVAPGTKVRLRIKKITPPDPETGGFEGRIHDAHFENARGERIPNIPHLMSLFMFWDNKLEQTELEDEVIQDYVIPEGNIAEFGSRTLSQIVHGLAGLSKESVNWRKVIHDAGHLAHDSGRLRTLIDEGVRHGVIATVLHQRPQHTPAFLEEV